MSTFKLKFFCEHAGPCIWGSNENAKEKYGYAIDNEILPISNSLKDELNKLEELYSGYLDWNTGLSEWSTNQKKEFLEIANNLYFKLKKELGPDFKIVNEIESSLQ